MSSTALTRFFELAQKDAAVQERIVDAARHVRPLEAIMKVAMDAGFEITSEELKVALSGELTDQQLTSVAGGLAAPGEWFAEFNAVSLQKIKRDGDPRF